MSNEIQNANDGNGAPTKGNKRVFKPSERVEAETAGEIIAPLFPVECLPPVLRKMAEGVAEIERLPVAMTAPMVLAIASAALGRGVMLRGLRGKLTPPNLYVCVCKESGTGGSSAFARTTAPLEGMQARLIRTHKEETAPALEADKLALQSEIEKHKSTFKKSEDGGEKCAAREAMRAALVKLREIEDALREPLLWTSDTTPEALADKLAANDDTLAQINPDAGDSFSSMLGGYRDKAARDGSHALWLKAFSNEPHTVTRAKSSTINLRRPCLAMLLIVTPHTARKHLEDKSLLESGFLGRLLLCDPRAEMNEGTFEEALAAPSLPSEITQPYEAAIWKALALYRRPRGFGYSSPFDDDETDAGGGEGEREPFIVEADKDALRVIHEDRLRQCAAWKDAESERELIARETEMATRIALVLHIYEHMTFRREGEATWKVRGCNGHEKPLTAETMRAAIMIRDWFKQSLASMLAPQRAAAADESFAKLMMCADKYGWHKEGITPRHLISHRVSGTRDAAGARKLLEQWQAEGKLTMRERKAEGTGRKPGPAWFVTGWERAGRG